MACSGRNSWTRGRSQLADLISRLHVPAYCRVMFCNREELNSGIGVLGRTTGNTRMTARNNKDIRKEDGHDGSSVEL